MYLAQIFSIILFSFGAAAIYLGISVMRKKYRDYSGNLVLGLLCFASAIWCYGFGTVYFTTNTEVAYWGRTIGMIGVIAFLILAQILVGTIVEFPLMAYMAFCVFAALGVMIYFPVISRDAATYYMGAWGMTYTFNPGIANDIYTIYTVIYAIDMLVSVILMFKYAENRRSKNASRKIGMTLIIVFFGMVLDTILPMYGFGAVPGSSISQFLGLLVAYYAIVDVNRARITPMNMSQYIYDSVSEPVMVFNTKGLLKLANMATVDMLGNTIGMVKSENIHITQVFNVEDNFFDYDGKHRTDDTIALVGNVPVQIQTSRIEDSYGDIIGFIIIVKNMSRIKEMMESLEEAKRQAEENSLAKSTFLANMSHEIRTPLNAIVGFSELLIKSEIPTEDKEQAEDIRNSSYNLLAVINDILDISKIESGKMELNEVNYSIANVIKDAYLITEMLAKKKGIEFSMQVDENIPNRLFGDPVRIRGVLVNILNNAVKYTKEGSVKFVVNLIENDYTTAVIQFRIIDTGIGIKESDKDNLFESFLRVDGNNNTSIEGTGLGLAIVKGFLALMNGTVEIESTYGEGSEFIVTIPQKIIDREVVGNITIGQKGKPTSSSIGNVKYDGIRVLAVDDNKVNLKVITKILGGYGMDVIAATSGIEAIDLCRTNKYDIVLMDQMMPVMDGVEAMKYIRALGGIYVNGECSIIALTANAIAGVKEQLLSEGFDDYLSKPINFPEMEEMFTRIMIEKNKK